MKPAVAFLLALSITVGGLTVQEVSAQSTDIKGEVDELNSAVKDKRQRVRDLEKLIDSYRARIKEQESKQSTLANEILLLENRIREKELAILRSKTELEALALEIESLEAVIRQQEGRIGKQKELTAELIRRIRQSDDVSTIDVFLTKPSLSSFFDRLEELKRLERDLGTSIEKLKDVRTSLEQAKQARDERRKSVQDQQEALEHDQLKLEGEKNFKISLVAQTQNSQEEFARILYELRQEQEEEADDISRLEEQLKDTLNTIDEALARGDILLNWPLSGGIHVTAHFHDSDYPFRHYFEHPGTDIRAPVGTPVRAAAGGYVAWNKTGKQYGNYTMIVHPGGIATIYAHLSKFIAKPDTYVERGDVIALSGGRPGDQGAGLSTGPHLHFEVRQNGIPVNPINFLPSVD